MRILYPNKFCFSYYERNEPVCRRLPKNKFNEFDWQNATVDYAEGFNDAIDEIREMNLAKNRGGRK